MKVTTRSYNTARTGANVEEAALTPHILARNFMVKHRSLHVDDDPRIEAQPLYVPGIKMSDGKVHDVVYVATMANNIWAFDANDGTAIWKAPTHLGRPVKPKPTPHPGFPSASEIDIWGVNILWGILGTPVIDAATNKLYAVAWTSPDGSTAQAGYQLHEVDITDGKALRSAEIQSNHAGQDSHARP